jgi:ribosomal protein S18 acetylase RimI-like enzyme
MAMITDLAGTQLLVREAVEEDRQKISNLLHFELRVHRHLDWRTPLEWLGSSPFIVGEVQGRIVGALACPVDPKGVAWLQLFVSSTGHPVADIWRPLWSKALSVLEAQPGLILAAIPMHDWLVTLLKQDGFTFGNEIVVLQWGYDQPLERGEGLPFTIRPMQPEELDRVWWVDAQAFKVLWQNSLPSLELAFKQSSIATVAEDETGIIGYQISTTSTMGGHLARLAVLPAYQGRRIGYALVNDLLRQFVFRGIFHVTVNTQADNPASLHLYEKVGFQLTGERYPVYIKTPGGLRSGAFPETPGSQVNRT